MPWLILQRTNSAFDVGLLVFLRYIPFLIGGVYGGVVADRSDNRRVLLLTQGVEMLVAAGISVAAFMDTSPTWIIYTLAALSGSVLIFDNPSKYALIYQLVPRASLPDAVTQNAGLQNAARVVGPALGGLLIVTVGVGWCFVIDSLSFLAVIVALRKMRIGELFPLERAFSPRGFSAVASALRHVRSSAVAQAVLAISFVSGLFGFTAVRTLLPVLASVTLKGGADVFGALFAAYGLGAVIGAIVGGRILRRRKWAFLIGAAIFNAALLGLAGVHQFAVALVVLLVVGVGWTAWSAQAMVALQNVVSDSLRGRMTSLYTYTLLAGAPFGGLLAGWLAHVAGTELAFAVSGLAGLLVTALAVLRIRLAQWRAEQAADV